MNWVEIATKCSRHRYELLSEQLRNIGFANAVSFLEINEADFKETVQSAQANFRHIRVGDPFGLEAANLFNNQSLVQSGLKSVDCLSKEGQIWWPKSVLYNGLIALLSENAKSVDFSGTALIVGCESAARVCVAALFRAGFQQFIFCDADEKKAEALKTDLETFYLGLKAKSIGRHGLVMLAGTSTIAVNTTSFGAEDELAGELFYFNFLRNNGVLWDFNLVSRKHPLLKEAEEVGIRTVLGSEIASFADAAWVRGLTSKPFPRTEYAKLLQESLSV